MAEAPRAPEQAIKPLPPVPLALPLDRGWSFAAQLNLSALLLPARAKSEAALGHWQKQAARSAPELGHWLASTWGFDPPGRRRRRSPGAGRPTPPPWSAIPTHPETPIRNLAVGSASRGNHRCGTGQLSPAIQLLSLQGRHQEGQPAADSRPGATIKLEA